MALAVLQHLEKQKKIYFSMLWQHSSPVIALTSLTFLKPRYCTKRYSFWIWLLPEWKVIRRLICLWKNQRVTTRANELANSILKTVKLLGNDRFPMYLEINEMNNLFCLFWQYCCQAFKQNIFTSVKLCSCYLLNIFINNVIEIYNLTCFLSTLNISFLRYKL